ncbi:helix-turn-helix domain-containing protein [Ovoidimarina sediminis]|uniref:helix-turn-helix domain-containing protein n=1 Tax=Ovoidimarina sediminis TaxID=3079856 RepID=UPI0029145232|nr:helix-turn-helix domain-containing protein [Rhodophyticola sp. MJ-SS7]MDU8942008.1 helix-turn-helix domain-containing protein [Rhodophyticola sp. MJ-SS7]
MKRRDGTPDASAFESMKGFDDFDVRLGDVMRGERATLGKSLLDVQRDLKIKATYIAAIENADPSAFESPGFVAGYVRSYARYLGLDPEWAFQTFCEEGAFESQAGLVQPSGKTGKTGRGGKAKDGKAPQSKSPGIRDPFKQPSVSYIPSGEARFSNIEPGAVGSVAVLLALVAAIGYGGWSVLQEVQKVQFTPIDETPGVLSQLDPVAPLPDPAVETGEEENPSTDIAALSPPTPEAFDRLYRPQALDVPVLVARDGPIATIEPGSLGVFTDPPRPPSERTELAGAAPSFLPSSVTGASPLPEEIDTALAAATPVQVSESGPPEVALFAVRPSWVRVRSSDGTVIFEKILDAGERFVLPQTEEAHSLRAGNAGSLYFTVGDQTFGPAGDGASVVRDVALSATVLPQTYALADPEADADLARFVAVAEAQSPEPVQ